MSELNIPDLPHGFQYQIKVTGDVIKINGIRDIYWSNGHEQPGWVFSGFEIDTKYMSYDEVIDAVQREVNSLVDRINNKQDPTRIDALIHVAEQFAGRGELFLIDDGTEYKL